MTSKTEIKKSRQSAQPHDDANVKEDKPKSPQKRGRPRVENRDASAIERRRTQIRVAQRAYRARKDSTISQLQAENAELQKMIRSATLDLQEISDKVAIQNDLQRNIVREDLYQTITKLMDADRLHESGRGESESEGNDTPPNPDLTKNVSSLTSPPTHGQDSDDGQLLLESNIDDESLDLSNINWTDPFQIASSSQNANSLFATLAYQQIPQPVSAVPTFSWQETTFARRLLRHSHETCLRHIENPSERYADFYQRARFSLAHMSKDVLIQKLKISVAKSNTEPLEDWSMPMLHVGRSGMHYDSSINEEPMDYRSSFERNVGPFPLPDAAINLPESIYPDQVADYLGLEGDWMDPRDVEAYLRGKGVSLSGASSTAVYNISISFRVDGATVKSASLGEWKSRLTGRSLDFMEFDDEGQAANVLFQDADSETGEGKKLNKRLLLSVDQLVEKLNDKAVCLGRAPGYRQSDVDAALNVVLAQARQVAVA